MLDAEQLVGVLEGLALLALLTLAVGIALRFGPLVVAALVILGGEYTLYLLVEIEGIDERAPLYAGGFVLTGELAYAAVAPQVARWEPAPLAGQVAVALLSIAAAVVLGVFLLGGAGLIGGVGLPVLVLGVLAAATLFALLVGLAARSAPQARPQASRGR